MSGPRLILPWEEMQERRTRVREWIVLAAMLGVLLWGFATCEGPRGVVRAPRAPVMSSGR